MIKQGLTLYSLTNEWVSGAYELDRLLEKVATLGLGPGVEIVGFQTVDGFPDVTPRFAAAWQEMIDEHRLVPTCLGSNIDVAQRSDRPLNDDEMTNLLLRQMKAARSLGFGVVRIQIGASPSVIERVTPVAEDWGLRLGMELHAPEGACTPRILEVRDLYERIGSKNLGFIPDFSATMRAVPPGVLADLRSLGLTDELADGLVAEWAGAGAPFERYGRFTAAARAAGAPQEVIDACVAVFTMHGRETVETWREIADRIVHVHGKCYEFDEAGQEPSIDYPALIGLLADVGYDGYISAEWEGHVYLGPDQADGFAMVAAQQELVRRCLKASRGSVGVES